MTAQFSGPQIALFLLVLARAGGLVVSAPVIGDPQTPRMVKVILAVMLSVLLIQAPSVTRLTAPTDLLPFSANVLAQLVIGIALGLVARTIFYAVQTAGGIVSFQTGVSLASVLNPMTQQPDTMFSQLFTVIAGLTFLAVHGDVWLVASLARSYDLAPVSGSGISPQLVGSVVTDFTTITKLGVQIAMPIGVSVFAANLILGVLSRALPQLNLFVLSMPLDMLLGLVALGGGLAAIMMVVSQLTNDVPQAMLGLFPTL
ncbi:MAG TPA: flagellar biosynthetic protein FliR [Chloroflexota bacterium]|nr:flagellar biosynthetic protein FliR [Chloroflexota bacterium]